MTNQTRFLIILIIKDITENVYQSAIGAEIGDVLTQFLDRVHFLQSASHTRRQ